MYLGQKSISKLLLLVIREILADMKGNAALLLGLAGILSSLVHVRAESDPETAVDVLLPKYALTQSKTYHKSTEIRSSPSDLFEAELIR